MIPADAISFQDDTAWLAVDCEPDSAPAQWEQDDKPCDECGGEMPSVCFVCIDGRHMFDLEVECSCACHRLHSKYPGMSHDVLGECRRDGSCVDGTLTYRVSIVPGMVLPIVADEDDLPDCPPLVCIDPPAYWPEGSTNPGEEIPITLPPAAKPGMWAVELQVAA